MKMCVQRCDGDDEALVREGGGARISLELDGGHLDGYLVDCCWVAIIKAYHGQGDEWGNVFGRVDSAKEYGPSLRVFIVKPKAVG